jgi:hypothetical protein
MSTETTFTVQPYGQTGRALSPRTFSSASEAESAARRLSKRCIGVVVMADGPHWNDEPVLAAFGRPPC